jgi:hypothetical protein
MGKSLNLTVATAVLVVKDAERLSIWVSFQARLAESVNK